MNKWDGRTDYRRLEEAKETAGRMMHMHYCENDVEGIVSLFAPDILWMGAGEDEYIVGREACVKAFAQMKAASRGAIYGMRNMTPYSLQRESILLQDGCGLPQIPAPGCT